MTEAVTLEAEKREKAGKNIARALRGQKKVPAVVYSKGKVVAQITLDRKELIQLYGQAGFFSRLVDLRVGNDTIRTLPKDIQLHPLTEFPLHVDFLEVDENSRVTVQVPVHFKNAEKCRGIKRGGVLNVVRHEVELLCSPSKIPAELVVDLTEAMIGDSIHISEIELPEGVTPTIMDRDFTVATIAGRMAEIVDEEPEEGEEGEVAEGEEGEQAEDSEEASKDKE